MTLGSLALTAAVKARALELGFDDVAVGSADPPEHGAAFERWLDAGHAGEMSYLERGRAARLDPARLLAGCRSVVAVALAYGPLEERPGWSGIARYARGRDYHDVMRPRLAALVAALREAGGPDVRSRAAVDTSAVLERDLAARAGLGWIGKNTNLLHPSRGSYVFLGIVLTTAELAFDSPVPDRCGSCTACLDACPTEAFVAPYVLDARRCIAYLTIEHRGDIDARWRGRLGGWLFGCDVCQEVCPWNRKAPPARELALAPADPPPAAEEVLGMDERTFRERFHGSPLKRARRSGLARNAALVLSRRTDPAALDALRRACSDDDPVVAAAARWALQQAPAAQEQELQRFRWHPGCGVHGKPVRKEDSVTDKIQKDDGKDVESGKPVQLDKDQDKQPGHEQPGHQQPGHQQPGHPQQDRPGQQQPGQKPAGEPARPAR